MKKMGHWILGCGAMIGLVGGFAVQPVAAIAPFHAEFVEMYIVKEGGTPEQQKLAAAYDLAETGKCWTCHANMVTFGEDRAFGQRVRNSYGRALSALLDKNNFGIQRRREVPEEVWKGEIREALLKVAEMKSDPDDPDSPTFGELLSRGEMPSDGKPDPEDVERVRAELQEEGRL